MPCGYLNRPPPKAVAFFESRKPRVNRRETLYLKNSATKPGERNRAHCTVYLMGVNFREVPALIFQHDFPEVVPASSPSQVIQNYGRSDAGVKGFGAAVAGNGDLPGDMGYDVRRDSV